MMSLKKYMPAWVQRIGLTTALLLFVAGIVFWGGFNWALEATNKESFCISCHEMEENVFREYQNTVHYTNRTGVRATCPDCHVPKEWGPKMIRKIQASNEVLHKILGSIDTPEKVAELEKAVMKLVDGSLGAIARPARVHFISGLPKTRSGKMLRRSIQIGRAHV